jgi:hypothetical protein
MPTKEEVKNTVYSILQYNSPNPDGFGSSFYISCWHIVKEDVVKATKEIFFRCFASQVYGSSYIVLIPKVPNPKSLINLGLLAFI